MFAGCESVTATVVQIRVEPDQDPTGNDAAAVEEHGEPRDAGLHTPSDAGLQTPSDPDHCLRLPELGFPSPSGFDAGQGDDVALAITGQDLSCPSADAGPLPDTIFSRRNGEDVLHAHTLYSFRWETVFVKRVHFAGGSAQCSLTPIVDREHGLQLVTDLPAGLASCAQFESPIAAKHVRIFGSDYGHLASFGVGNPGFRLCRAPCPPYTQYLPSDAGTRAHNAGTRAHN